MARKRKSSSNNTIIQRRKKLKAKTDNQELYIDSMQDSDVTFCSGPAGSGKTSVSVGLACEYLMEEKVKRIIITRPVVESGRGLGHLPGTLVEKINPYLVPILEEMNMYLTKARVENFREEGIIELCPLEYMRGRHQSGGLLTCMDELYDIDGVSVSELDYCDIIRSDIVGKILRKLHEFNPAK